MKERNRRGMPIERRGTSEKSCSREPEKKGKTIHLAVAGATEKWEAVLRGRIQGRPSGLACWGRFCAMWKCRFKIKLLYMFKEHAPIFIELA
jgi:hypothetical protein